jgi:hypothetical protein
MCFGGNFEPAYVLTITALASELQPTTNKRNAALIQKHMEEGLGVPPSRGFVHFIPAAEESIAHNGKTLAGELDDVGKAARAYSPTEENGTISSRRNRASKRLSVKVRRF